MNTVIVHPKTNEQWEALKAVMKVLKIQFEELTSTTKEPKDWWNGLSDENKQDIEQGILELDQNQGIPHEQVDAQIKALIDAKRK